MWLVDMRCSILYLIPEVDVWYTLMRSPDRDRKQTVVKRRTSDHLRRETFDDTWKDRMATEFCEELSRQCCLVYSLAFFCVDTQSFAESNFNLFKKEIAVRRHLIFSLLIIVDRLIHAWNLSVLIRLHCVEFKIGRTKPYMISIAFASCNGNV
jgi:predicted DNA-binding ribbon-helix-helix protein